MTDDIARLGIEIDATQADKAKTSLDALTAAGGRAEAATGKLGKATGATAAELDAFQKKAVAAAVAQTGMTEAQAAAALGFKATATAADVVTSAHGRVTGSSLKVRESLVLMREASVGNLTRMAGSATILAGSFGLMTGAAIAAAIPFVALAAAAGVVALAFVKGSEEAAKLSNALAVTNGYSGLTASSFEDMAARVSKASDTGIGKTKANIEALVASGKYTGDTIEQIVGYSARLAQLTGEDSGKIVKSFEDMKGGVVAFAVKHEETYHDLTLAQIDYIAQLEKEGRHHEAELQFATDINAKVHTLTAQYGVLENVMHTVGNAASSLWDKILGIGRPDTTLEKLNKAMADLKAKSDDMLSGQGSYGAFADGYTNSPSDVSAQAATVRKLTAQYRQEQADAAAKAKASQANDDAIQRKYGHFKNAPSDDTGQKTSTVDAAVAQAQTAQLQAILGLNTDIDERASIQKQIAASEEAVKAAQIDRQKAEIDKAADESHISRAVADELMSRLDGVKLLNDNTAALKQRLSDEQAHDALIRQGLDIANAQSDAEASVLQAQEALVTDIDARRKIETRLLDLADAKAVADAQAVIDSKLASAAQKQIAQIQIEALHGAHGYKQQLIDQQQLIDTIHQQAGLAQDTLANQSDILHSQEGLAQYGFQRDTLTRQILAVDQQIAKSKAVEALAVAEAAKDEVAIAKARANLASLEKVQANETAASQDTFLQSYDKVTGAIDSMTSAFGQHDWVHAASSLIEAMGSAGNALGPSSSLGSALSSMASSLGPMAAMISASIQIGQAGGVAFAKATGGNSQNAKTGGYFGLVGGIIGSFFGESDANIQRRKDQNTAAASAADAAWQAELKHRTEGQQQEIALAQLSGDALKVTNIQRQQELAGLEASSRARQEEIYRITDQIDALQKAADARTSEVADAAQQLDSIGAAAKSASQSLGQFLATLTTGDAAMNSPLRQYMMTKTNLVGVNGRVAGGDTAALGEVQGAVQAFLQASQAFSPDRTSYGRDLAMAQRSVQQAKDAADAQVSLAQQQLDAIKSQVSGLSIVNQSVLTVAAAVANLHAALDSQTSAKQALSDAQSAAGAASPSTSNLETFSSPDYAYYVTHNKDLNDQFTAQTGYARKRSITEYGQLMWTTFDNSGRQFTPYGQKFAMGGAFTGPVTDILTRPTQLNVGQGGEAGAEAIMPLRRGSDGRLGVAADGGSSTAIAALAERVGRLTTLMEASNRNTERTAKILTRVSRDGDSLLTELKVA